MLGWLFLQMENLLLDDDDTLFQEVDMDHDGVLNGQEAIAFCKRFALSRENARRVRVQ